jgi:O-antigen ligase/predicted negative regulator of RcsB-dependent stress response
VRRADTAQAKSTPTTRLLSMLVFLASAAVVLAVPLVFDSRALDMFRGPKSELALACWGVLAAVFVVKNLGGNAWRDRWWAVWAGVAAGGAVSAIACPEPLRALAALVPLVLVALGWGAVRQLSEERRRSLLRLVVWAGAIEAVLVLLFLRPSWQPEVFHQFSKAADRYNWVGTLGNPADVATFLVLPALLAAQRAAAARRRRLVWWGTAALLAGVVLGTRTITGVVALVAGGLVIAWRAAPRRWRLPVVAGVMAAAVLVFLVTPLAGRVRTAVSEVKSGGLIQLASFRGAAFAAAGAMFAARPVTGIGFGLFEANSFRFQSPEALAERGRILGLVTGFGEAHNELLQYAAETGILGLALAAAGVAFALRRRGERDRGLVDPAPLVAAATMLALAQFPLHLAAIAAQWAVLAALTLPAMTPPPVASRGRERGQLLAVGILAGIALAAAWQRYQAGIAFEQGKVLVDTLRAAPARSPVTTELARAALANLQLRRHWLPYSWQAAVILGNVAVEAGDTRAALASFSRALALANRPEIQFDLGMTLLQAGNREAGMARLEKAVKLNPVVFRSITDANLANALRTRLDASGYGAKHAWMYEGTPAATP